MSEADKDELKSIQRKLWIINGMIRYNFKEHILRGIADRYEAIGLVPQHYNFAPLMIFRDTELREPSQLKHLRKK